MLVTFKASGGKVAELELTEDSTIADVKKDLEKPLDIPQQQLKLIYKGRITKDADTIKALKVADKDIIHVVKSGVTPAPSSSNGSAAAEAASNNTTTPNPATSSTSTTTNPTTNTTTPNAGAANPFANPFMSGLGGMGGFGGMPNFDPSVISQMLQNPMMQQMMQQIASSPDMMRSVLNSNPMLQQMAASNPLLSQTLSNPQAMSQMFNPSNLQALLGGAGQPNFPQAPVQPTNPSATGSNPAGPGAMPDFSAFLGGAGAGNSAGTTGGANPFGNISQMMQNPEIQRQMQQLAANMGGAGGMFGGLGAPGNAPAAGNANATYENELSQLQDMGFADRDANLRALRSTNGDVSEAINRLLNEGFGN